MTSDPRLKSALITLGPPDLIGSEVFGATRVTIDGVVVDLPETLPGVPEYITVAHAEVEANRLRGTLLNDLDRRDPVVPYQGDFARVFDFFASVGTVVGNAAGGLEAFANHHISIFCAPQAYNANGQPDGPAPTVAVGGETLTFRQITDRPLHERLGQILPELRQSSRPTGEMWWPKLRQVQALAALNRHAILDATSRKGLEGVKPLIQRFCNREYAGAAGMMLAAFEFLVPGWISPARAGDLPPVPPEN
jgi:hypothetical protein